MITANDHYSTMFLVHWMWLDGTLDADSWYSKDQPWLPIEGLLWQIHIVCCMLHHRYNRPLNNNLFVNVANVNQEVRTVIGTPMKRWKLPKNIDWKRTSGVIREMVGMSYPALSNSSQQSSMRSSHNHVRTISESCIDNSRYQLPSVSKTEKHVVNTKCSHIIMTRST